MRVAIVGEEVHTTCYRFCGTLNTVDKEIGRITSVIHTGGHLGEMAASWAIPRKIEVTACNPDEMLEYLPDVLVVFVGAQDLVQRAKDAGVRVLEVT